jgi:hypothetical protein
MKYTISQISLKIVLHGRDGRENKTGFEDNNGVLDFTKFYFIYLKFCIIKKKTRSRSRVGRNFG